MIVPHLKIISDQQQLSDKIQDRLDIVIEKVLSKTSELSMEDLEDVQAAMKPYEEQKRKKEQ